MTPEQYLKAARPYPGENKFVLGTFERGITVYRQQIRALNLIYSFVEARRPSGQPYIRKKSRIVVIGGGAFGVTAAAAAAYAEFDVVLLERNQGLLHLQRGCDTRWLHPRFYDWPAPEAESTNARLPFLDWSASSAGQVAARIEREFVDLQNNKLRATLQVDFGVMGLNVRRTRGIYEVNYKYEQGQHSRACENIIYAVGFGVEKGPGANPSYWRNDHFGQSDLDFNGTRISYLVSGFGDGGLIDLFRLTICDFRHDRIFREMFPNQRTEILDHLDGIRRSWGGASGFLYDAFSVCELQTHKQQFEDAKQVLRKRLRIDTNVTLNGDAVTFREGLSLHKSSFSNALLAFLLFRLSAFSYEAGRLDLTVPDDRKLETAANGQLRPDWLKPNVFITRHGTKPEIALQQLEDGELVKLLRRRGNVNSGEQIFPSGWWGRYTDPTTSTSRGNEHTPIEYVPPVLATHATTFVSTLARVLEREIDRRSQVPNGKKFRLTLHRLTRFDAEDVFQQITPYVGRVEGEAAIGRYFPVQKGIVGLACKTGSLVIATRKNKKTFDQIWRLTDLKGSGAKAIGQHVQSLFCCPFFAPDGVEGSQRVVMALFADSADPEFFDDSIQEIISYACRGFVDLLELLNEKRMLHCLAPYDIGYEVSPDRRVQQLIATLARLGVKFVDASVKGWKSGLTFKKLRSLDLQVRYEDAPM